MSWAMSYAWISSPKEFGRIATQNAKNVILQKIREEERKVLFSEYYENRKRCGDRCGTALCRQEMSASTLER